MGNKIKLWSNQQALFGYIHTLYMLVTSYNLTLCLDSLDKSCREDKRKL